MKIRIFAFAKPPNTVTMDQPKQERTLSLLYLLAGNCCVPLKKMMERLDLSKRSMFRYFATLREHGYDVKLHPGDIYRLDSYEPCQAEDSERILFTHEEAVLLSHLIETLDNTNVLKPTLQGKLASVFYQETVAPYIVHPWNSKNVEVLSAAIRDHLQIYVKGYECSYKGMQKDYVLEPYQLNNNCIDLWAYDVADGHCKLLKVARLGEVTLLQKEWEYEDRHRQKTYDVFHIAGDTPLEHVKLRMELKAKNLLVEEYPLTMDQVYQKDGFWYWEGPIYGVLGAGRFVLGLCDAIELVEGDQLRKWVLDRAIDAGVKFSSTAPRSRKSGKAG